MFDSVEEVDQIEMEPKSEEAKQVPKMPNGALNNETSSPDSGHPSSRNFSVTSGLSDGSLSTEDSAAPDTTPRSAAVPPGAKSEGLPEESKVKHKVKDKTEEEDFTNNAVGIKHKVRCESVTQPLEDGVEKNSETQETGEGTTAMKTKKMEDPKTSKPQEFSLAERKENVSSDPMAPEVEKKRIFSADAELPRARDTYFTSQRDEAQALTESDESPLAIEMEKIPKAKVSMVPWSKRGCCEASSLSDNSAPHRELMQEEEQRKPSPERTESILSEEPEMESLSPYFDSVAGSESTKNEASSQEYVGNTFSVRTYIFIINILSGESTLSCVCCPLLSVLLFFYFFPSKSF